MPEENKRAALRKDTEVKGTSYHITTRGHNTEDCDLTQQPEFEPGTSACESYAGTLNQVQRLRIVS